MANKTTCPVTKVEFDKHATPDHGRHLVNGLDFDVRGTSNPFSSRNLGFFAGGKGTARLDGKSVKVQISASVTVIGSKDWEDATKARFDKFATPDHAMKLLKGMNMEVRGTAKSFSTGSLGWFAGGKGTIQLEDRNYNCQITCSMVVLGSKEAEAGTDEQHVEEKAA